MGADHNSDSRPTESSHEKAGVSTIGWRLRSLFLIYKGQRFVASSRHFQHVNAANAAIVSVRPQDWKRHLPILPGSTHGVVVGKSLSNCVHDFGRKTSGDSRHTLRGNGRTQAI